MRAKARPTVAVLTVSLCFLALTAWLLSADAVSAEDREQSKTLSLDGATLRLGMTFEEAQAALAERFDVRGIMPDADRPELTGYEILSKGASGKPQGSFTLENGRLIHASRLIGRYSEDAPAGTVLADFREALQQLSGEQRGRAQMTWEGGGVDNTGLAVDVADGTLHVIHFDSPNGSRGSEIYYAIQSDEGW